MATTLILKSIIIPSYMKLKERKVKKSLNDLN